MRHLVIGEGNLGSDIAQVLLRKGEDVHVLSRNNGWSYPKNESWIEWFDKADVYWITAGAGSIEGAHKDFTAYLDIHVRLPMQIIQRMPTQKKINLFSTDYLQNNEGVRDLYTLSKKIMEESAMLSGRSNISIYRIGSLYGEFKPLSTLPGKIIQRNKGKSNVKISRNIIVPTPTDWLAEKLVSLWMQDAIKEKPSKVRHLAPLGDISIAGFAREVLGNEIEISSFYDRSRPRRVKELESCPWYHTNDTWLDLWKSRKSDLMGAVESAICSAGK